MTTNRIARIVLALIALGLTIASVFVDNPASQHLFTGALFVLILVYIVEAEGLRAQLRVCGDTEEGLAEYADYKAAREELRKRDEIIAQRDRMIDLIGAREYEQWKQLQEIRRAQG